MNKFSKMISINKIADNQISNDIGTINPLFLDSNLKSTSP